MEKKRQMKWTLRYHLYLGFYIGILEGSLGVGFRVYQLYLGVIYIVILEGSFLLPAKI